MGVDFAGATPFWRAAYSLDVEAMRLLVRYGADPSIPSMTYGAPRRDNDPSGLAAIAAGGPHVPPFHAASGVGYGTSRVAQQHRHVPDGWLPAAKYFLEELGVDVNIRDADGFTALHHAAARGDNAMISTWSAAAPTSWPSIARARRRWTWPTARSSGRSRSPRRSRCSRAWAPRTTTTAAPASEPPVLADTKVDRTSGQNEEFRAPDGSLDRRHCSCRLAARLIRRLHPRSRAPFHRRRNTRSRRARRHGRPQRVRQMSRPPRTVT